MSKHISRQKTNWSRYWRKTWRNKVGAIALIGVGLISVYIENDVTFLIFAVCLGVPMFFAKENWIL